MQTTINITSINSAEKKSTKSLTNINPNLSNTQLKQAAQLFTAISDETYKSADRIDRIDIEENYPGTKTEPTLSVSEDGTITYNGDGQLGINLNNNLFGIIQNNEISAKDNDGFAQNSFSGIILASEGTNYSAKSISFTVSK